ncbi:hypothetical protein NST17_20115 [Caldifermentibacillus hisashii]|uniref:Bacillus phage SPbeta YonK domain-containing protein n=1 Tax=Caldifermentibacillus hisashii TaxID=996558 RepID=A0ABU9K344_9BACI
MEQDEKTEIIAYYITETLGEIKNLYGEEFNFTLNADYLGGKIIIKVEA